MAVKEEEMRRMIEKEERFREYLEEKKVELNTDKIKILRLRKGGGRRDKRIWRWKGKVTK